MANDNDSENHPYIRANFSNCGSFCILRCDSSGVEYLNSVFLEKRQAKTQMPAVWDEDTSYNRRLHLVGNYNEPTMIQLYQAVDRPHRNGLYESFNIHRGPEHRIRVNITVIPAHLVKAEIYLLVGKSGDDLLRILFLPSKGPPEIKHLRVTMNQILAKLDETARAVEPNIEELFRKDEEEEKWERSCRRRGWWSLETGAENPQEENLESNSKESQEQKIEE